MSALWCRAFRFSLGRNLLDREECPQDMKPKYGETNTCVLYYGIYVSLPVHSTCTIVYSSRVNV